jgi:hypothetical protein
MLRIRTLRASEDSPWLEVLPDCVLAGLNEDTDYVLDVGSEGVEAFVDDVPLPREGTTAFCWRPGFYAGRVAVEVVRGDNSSQRYLLDVSPSLSKSGQDEFDEMVTEIRAFDQSLLSGLSSATMAFGREGRSGRYELDVLLSRIREHGPSFLDAIELIVRSPHRFLAADRQVLPLSRVRRLHHTAFQDRRLAAIATGQALPSESMDSFQVNGLTSVPTFDTPANRTLMALLRRFRATVVSLEGAIQRCGLGSPQEDQLLRSKRRLHTLGALSTRARKLLFGTLFREVSTAETSAAGLTQIASQPNYSKAYRLGCRALSTQLDGEDFSDQLHVPPSWGIYETWCFLGIVTSTAHVTGCKPINGPSKAVTTERAVHFELHDGQRLEVLFQATFPSLKPTTNHRLGWSLSSERRPDIVLVHHWSSGAKAMVLDAKWRSGKSNVLQAMESAHIYHDALRIGDSRPSPCVLLLPGLPSVPELEKDKFIQVHGVGAVTSVRIAAAGMPRVQQLIKTWLES